MYNFRRRRCCSFNNHMNQKNNSYETLCNNVPSNEENYNNSCSCGFDDNEDNLFPTNPMYAQSYVPFQTMDQTFTPCDGLSKGTIFPELVSEYYPGLSMEEINFIEKTNIIGEGCNR